MPAPRTAPWPAGDTCRWAQTAPTRGTALAVYRPERGVVVRYEAGDANGADTFSYEICDTLDARATAEVTVTVGTSGCTI